MESCPRQDWDRKVQKKSSVLEAKLEEKGKLSSGTRAFPTLVQLPNHVICNEGLLPYSSLQQGMLQDGQFPILNGFASYFLKCRETISKSDEKVESFVIKKSSL